MIRKLMSLTLLVSWLGCAHQRPIQVLNAKPAAAHRTLGMVSAQGPNRASALHTLTARATEINADAVIVVGERPVGQVVVVTGRAIRWIAPPPQ